MNTRYLLLLLALCASATARAQITITESDFAARYIIGNTYTIDSGIVSGPLYVGSPGSSQQTFDFSTVALKNSPKTFTFYDATTTPHASLFPGATLALEEPLTIGTAYLYRALVPGVGIEDFGYYVLGHKQINTPPDLIEKLPLTYPLSWTYYSDTVTSTQGATTTKTYTITTRTIDAFGTLNLGTSSAACLRQKNVEYDNTASTVAEATTLTSVKSVSIYYVTKDGSFFAMEIDSNDENATTLTPTGMFSLQGHTSDVNDSPGLPGGLSLVALYPDPLRDNATMEYTLSENANVRADIVDMLGRTLGTIINARRGAGRYGIALNASALSAGAYNCRLSIDGHVTNHMMHVVK